MHFVCRHVELFGGKMHIWQRIETTYFIALMPNLQEGSDNLKFAVAVKLN